MIWNGRKLCRNCMCFVSPSPFRFSVGIHSKILVLSLTLKMNKLRGSAKILLGINWLRVSNEWYQQCLSVFYLSKKSHNWLKVRSLPSLICHLLHFVECHLIVKLVERNQCPVTVDTGLKRVKKKFVDTKIDQLKLVDALLQMDVNRN